MFYYIFLNHCWLLLVVIFCVTLYQTIDGSTTQKLSFRVMPKKFNLNSTNGPKILKKPKFFRYVPDPSLNFTNKCIQWIVMVPIKAIAPIQPPFWNYIRHQTRLHYIQAFSLGTNCLVFPQCSTCSKFDFGPKI